MDDLESRLDPPTIEERLAGVAHHIDVLAIHEKDQGEADELIEYALTCRHGVDALHDADHRIKQEEAAKLSLVRDTEAMGAALREKDEEIARLKGEYVEAAMRRANLIEKNDALVREVCDLRATLVMKTRLA